MKYTGLFLDSPVFIIKKPENSLEKSIPSQEVTRLLRVGSFAARKKITVPEAPVSSKTVIS